MTELQDGRATVEGVSLHYLTAGEGPPVLLLHGGIVDSASLSWGDVVEPLAADFEVYALDLPGYGGSDWPDAPYTTDYHVRMVEGFVDELDLAPLPVVGLSLGGGVALGLALGGGREAGLDERAVDRLVLVSSYGLGRDLPNGLLSYVAAQVPALNKLSLALLARSRRLTRASLGNVVHDVDAVPDEVVEELYGMLQQSGVGRAFRRWRKREVTPEGYRTCYVDRFEDIDPPTLLIHGTEDETFPVAWARRAAERIPDARLDVFEECAHWPPREHPERFVREVRAFLRA